MKIVAIDSMGRIPMFAPCNNWKKSGILFSWEGEKMEIFVNEEITLREMKEEDATSLYALIDENREYLRQFLGWVDANQSSDDVEAFIVSSKQIQQIRGGTNYVIWYCGNIVGVVSLNYVDWANHHTGIGYWLAADMQGRGIMTAAVRRLIDYVFDELGLNRVEIRCAVENQKSRAIPERLGFTYEGTLRQGEWLYDRYVNHMVYGLLKSEWRRG
jgi:ribosomal-protein-serine acetyltransferase